ncbi:MAG TPA: hypothetical protein VM165_12800 [Planctomycetaceae bacterium]|nr:hypothetical protein [Planctomycetaceae bacterium]
MTLHRLAAALLIAFGVADPLFGQGYLITDLGTFGGPTAEANAINNAGQIAGSANTASDVHAFLWNNGVLTDLGLPGSNAVALSSDGRAVGSYFPPDATATHAFLYQNGAPVDLGFLPGFLKGNSAVGVNKFAQVVGNGTSGSGYSRVVHPYSWQSGTYTDLTDVLGKATVSGINDAGEIVGTMTLPDGGGNSGFILHNGQVTLIGSLGLSTSAGKAINANGDVAGYSAVTDGGYHAVLFHNGSLTDLGTTPSADSFGVGLNNVGQVVGYLQAGYGQHAFVYGAGGIQDVNDLIDSQSGWLLIEAAGIDDAGRIIGSGNFQGNQRAYLATPTDQPLRPAVPSNVVATGEHNRIALTWNAAPRATSYRVKRSFSNAGPFATMATMSGSQTSYDDTHVLRRRGYYYVVSAVNSVGESPNSAAVYAQP